MEEKNLPVLFTPNFQIEKQLKPIEYLFFIHVQIETRQLCKGSFIEWLLCCCYSDLLNIRYMQRPTFEA